MKLKIIVTTGDVDGIGLEVACKALLNLEPQRGVQFLLFRSSNSRNAGLGKLFKKYKTAKVASLDAALTIEDANLIEIASDLSPAHWVEQSALACLHKKAQALCTGPLSKTSIRASGFKDLGHTDILKRVSRTKKVHMGFIGDSFSVVLATGHIGVSQISKHISFSTVTEAILHADSLRKLLPAKQRRNPVGVLGLNPHAGELGLIGNEELSIFPELRSWAEERGIPLEGPLVPDAAFFPSNWKRYSVYVALYHDQGLIPFKMVHGQDSGVHMTLGIPFIRTSVDHGTAKDIFGKGKANASSMRDALLWAVKLARLKE